MEGVEIPSYFLCPISLELMRDPVTLRTGITYDRDSIERWIFDMKQSTCPVTKQPLEDRELTPNHTLRRLIQAWCTLNSSNGVDRIPTPRSPIDKAQIAKLLEDARLLQSRLGSLRELKMIVAESDRNRRCVEATPGVVDFLASVIVNYGSEGETSDASESATACDEALVVLRTLEISEEGLLDVFVKNGGITESLLMILRRSNCQSQSNAMLILNSLLGVIPPVRSIGIGGELFREIVNVVRDRISQQATKAGLHALVRLCSYGNNRVKAVEAGAVHALVELLLESSQKGVCELALAGLDCLCGCADGRGELVRHRAAIPAVSKKILRVSQLASEKAVRILHSVARHSATAAVLQEMVNVGVVSKLCLVLQVGCGGKMEEKAREILKLHSRVWKDSPCLSHLYKSAYPMRQEREPWNPSPSLASPIDEIEIDVGKHGASLEQVIHFTRGRGEEVGTGTVLDVFLSSSGPRRAPCATCTNESLESRGVMSSCLNCFLAGGVLYRFEYGVSPALFLAKARGGTCTLAVSDPSEMVIHRANYLQTNGFRCYSVFKTNCEDFAIYCKTGLLVAERGVVGQSGQAISIIGGPLAAVLSTPFRLITTNVYGMAVTAVGVYCASRYIADIGNRIDVVRIPAEELTAGLASGRVRIAEGGNHLTLPR
ncbi:hypothetical protein BHM03_00037366 [Ensete ventricosum]|uniref:U-box domain-containing protein n=1 Tax=Ensete ventricosum TaxID=4639 RepID=A0A445MK41_ENSVE|nr:hypothetical protein BHM03_00037366 [Ensete ventricosum]